MRHRKSGVKLGRTSSHRKAMFRNMVTSLFKYDRIRTTDVKAKALRKWADHVITLAKRGDLHARRQALSIVREKAVVHQLFADAEKRFGGISGGYTRIVKLGRRPGDTAPVSMIELLDNDKRAAKPKAKKKAGPAVKPSVTPASAPTAAEKSESAAESPEEAVQTPAETELAAEEETGDAPLETAETSQPADTEAPTEEETKTVQ